MARGPSPGFWPCVLSFFAACVGTHIGIVTAYACGMITVITMREEQNMRLPPLLL